MAGACGRGRGSRPGGLFEKPGVLDNVAVLLLEFGNSKTDLFLMAFLRKVSHVIRETKKSRKARQQWLAEIKARVLEQGFSQYHSCTRESVPDRF